MPNSFNIVIVSPRNDFKFNLLNAIIEPLAIFGKKYFNSVLVGSYISKSKYNNEIITCLFLLKKMNLFIYITFN